MEKTSLDEKIIISEKAWRMSQSGYSSMFIMLNDQVTVEDLLKGIIIVSGNDSVLLFGRRIIFCLRRRFCYFDE